ncbi:hypothetical protein ABH926_003363 [Catenulispora sp. GP43]|uniref:hypothetical protein n=1 Tax=Catenulispora sp. GP43 TaxID=3156263 RepID=UPI003510FD76
MDERQAPGSDVPLRAWLCARVPFRQFRAFLLDAEALLNETTPSRAPRHWRAIRDAVGDDRAVLDAVRAMLAAQDLRLDLASHQGVWTLIAIGGTGHEAAVSTALAAVLDVGGPHRLKLCRVQGCGNVFVDWTSGAQRVGCRLHPARTASPTGPVRAPRSPS